MTAPSIASHPFTIRGRWPRGHTLLYAVDDADGPFVRHELRSALTDALRAWEVATVIRFAPVPEGVQADVMFAMRSGRHGLCPSFGGDARVAHTGPVQPGTFVHFDAERAWTPRGETGHSLYHTALHEVGHVLGLGHSPDAGAVLWAAFDGGSDEPAPADRAGVEALYGSNERGLPRTTADLVIRARGVEVGSLPLAAPPGSSDFAVFDTDGDGDQEVIVWRTDDGGYGAVLVYHFATGCLLERTVGPLMGMVASGVPVTCGRTRDGRRLLVSTFPNGRVVARAFTDDGLLGQAFDVDAQEESWSADRRTTGDLDGDGGAETVARFQP